VEAIIRVAATEFNGWAFRVAGLGHAVTVTSADAARPPLALTTVPERSGRGVANADAPVGDANVATTVSTAPAQATEIFDRSLT
jgi:hypothetical protein